MIGKGLSDDYGLSWCMDLARERDDAYESIRVSSINQSTGRKMVRYTIRNDDTYLLSDE